MGIAFLQIKCNFFQLLILRRTPYILKFVDFGTMLLERLVQVFLNRKGPNFFFLLFDVFLCKKNLIRDVIDHNYEHRFPMNLNLVLLQDYCAVRSLIHIQNKYG